MKKIIIFLSIIILLVFAVVIFSYLSKKNITGETIKEIYTFTKAICNETNYCQDYEIVCNNKGLVDMKPITGATVQHSLDWKDPRSEEIINRLCE